MATAVSVTIYSKPTPTIAAGTGIAMVGTSTSDGTVKSVNVAYYFDFTIANAGLVPASRAEISREDFLAIRQLLNLAIP